MKSFSNFCHTLTESRRKKTLHGLSVQSLQDFVTESLLEDLTEAERFLGATKRPLPSPELSDYLERIKSKTKGKKEKYEKPYIHGGNIVIKGESGKEFDLDALRTMVTKRPEHLLKQNEKMKHSDGTATQYYNLGLPALKGLAVDETTGDFVIVDTCPGAGACKTFCYAMKGGYVQWKDTSMSQTRILNFLMNDPDGFAAMLTQEIADAYKKIGKKQVKLVIRWHDAGDFFSPQYMDLAYDVARKFPEVDFYAYTKMASVAQSNKPDNFLINFSAGAQPSQEKQINFGASKHSRVVPKELFKDLMTRESTDLIQIAKKGKEDRSLKFKNPEAVKTFKQRLADHYKIDVHSILSYQEMMTLPKGTMPRWNVYVVPGEGDDSANRRDVIGTFLLFH